jgi:hypothetical protein
MDQIIVPEISQELKEHYLKFPVSNPEITSRYTVIAYGNSEFAWTHAETSEQFVGTIDEFNYYLLAIV